MKRSWSAGHPIDNYLNNVFCITQSTASKNTRSVRTSYDKYSRLLVRNHTQCLHVSAFFSALVQIQFTSLKETFCFWSVFEWCFFFFQQILTNALIILTTVTCQQTVPTMRAPFLAHVSLDTLGMAYLAVVRDTCVYLGWYTLEIFTIYMSIYQTDSIFFSGSYLQSGNIFLVKIMGLQREKICFSGCEYFADMLSFMTSLLFPHFFVTHTLHTLMAWRPFGCI